MRLKLVVGLLLVGGHGASAQTWGERASDTWTTMGLGMHVMLGKIGVGDMSGASEAEVRDTARSLIVAKARARRPVPASIGWEAPQPTWSEWASEKSYMAGLGLARGADAAWGLAYDGTAAAAPYAGQAWNVTKRLGAASYDATVSGMRAGAAALPDVLEWSADAAAAGATAFVSMGSATFACGAVMTPLAAMSAGAGYLACLPVTALGGIGGNYLLEQTYAHYGRTPRPYAFAAGALFGGLAGAEIARNGVAMFARRSLESQYGDFRTYSRAARSLTERNLKVWGPEVAMKRASGYHVDHVMSVKCGWVQGVGIASIAALGNLQYLTARGNLSLGAKGC